MKKLIAIGFVLAAIAGCSSPTSGEDVTSSPPQEKATCVSAGATYRSHFHETNGTCGPIDDSTVSVTSDGKISQTGSTELKCEPGKGAREEGCSVYIDVLCSGTTSSSSFTITEVGKVDWEADGSGASGSVTVTLTDTLHNYCRSTYVVTFTRL